MTAISYNFEIRFTAAIRMPSLRSDLDLPGHDNELRSHLHAGSDDVYMPAPLMSPAEIITLFIERLRRPANRAPTNFEIAWFLATHQDLASRGSRTPGTSGG